MSKTSTLRKLGSLLVLILALEVNTGSETRIKIRKSLLAADDVHVNEDAERCDFPHPAFQRWLNRGPRAPISTTDTHTDPTETIRCAQAQVLRQKGMLGLKNRGIRAGSSTLRRS